MVVASSASSSPQSSTLASSAEVTGTNPVPVASGISSSSTNSMFMVDEGLALTAATGHMRSTALLSPSVSSTSLDTEGPSTPVPITSMHQQHQHQTPMSLAHAAGTVLLGEGRHLHSQHQQHQQHQQHMPLKGSAAAAASFAPQEDHMDFTSSAAAAAAAKSLRVHSRLAQPLVELPYTVDSWSSYSAAYHPRNIMVDKPTDQASRWSSGSNNQQQFVTLKLERMAVVGHITFGKYYKGHVCNLRELKVYGGITQDNMIEILHAGLRNDDEPETFPVAYRINNVIFPCQYIKIVPLQAWGANFNYSIWFVMLKGLQDEQFTLQALNDFSRYREEQALRLCLKHFRQRNYLDVFDVLRNRCGSMLEDPLLTQLHQKIVLEGDFAGAEQALIHSTREGLFEDYISDCTYQPSWRRIIPDVNDSSPRMRGGHQMCIDVRSHKIYLLGGWDGHNDMSDFWVYDIQMRRWQCISQDTQRDGGPSARSCHKICIDSEHRKIYVLGGYVDPDVRTQTPLECDFYVYHLDRQQWEILSHNVHLENGPELIYDHQVCMDTSRQIIYVFGGRSINSRTMNGNDDEYSGLYKYDVLRREWRLVRADDTQHPYGIKLKSRIGHSMLLNPREQVLYIFAGQRNKEYLSDFYVYDIEHDEILEMTRDSSRNGGPDAGFTQRASIDLDRNEIFVFSGLMREKITAQETVKNSFWVYNVRKDRWTKVYQNENTDVQYWIRMENTEPCPRFAHQLVYDHETKVHYLFGGNPGEVAYAKERLDDFWELQLTRPEAHDVLRKTLFMLRRQQFREMCSEEAGQPVKALKFLQTKVAEVVDHEDSDESALFRTQSSFLFQRRQMTMVEIYQSRTQVYEDILNFYPAALKQPKEALVSLVPLTRT